MDRLERIKKETQFNHFNMPETGEFSLAFNLKKDDFDWLIKQAEKLKSIQYIFGDGDISNDEVINKVSELLCEK